MDKRDINILRKMLTRHNGEMVIISLSHKLYGKQKIKCKLECIFDEERIGFKVRGEQEIFIYLNKLISCGIEDGVFFADDLMRIEVKLY